MKSEAKTPWGTIGLFGVWVLIMLVVLVVWRSNNAPVAPPQELMGVLRPEPKPLTDFELIDQQGAPLDQARLRGKWSLLFFGYTYCPDVCPTTLSVLSMVYRQLQEENPDKLDTRVIFISVDPERDTPQKLADYMAFYNSEFIAATGTKAEIDNLAQQCGAGYIKEPETQPGQYLVSHTSAIFVTDPEGRLVATFSQPHIPQNIVSLYRQVQTFYTD